MSGAAITYVVDRMVASGIWKREAHESDRRKVLLRYADHGSEVARSFVTPLANRTGAALSEFSPSDLTTAHQVLLALIEAMRVFRTELRE